MDELFRHLGHTEQTWGHDVFTDREEIDVCEVDQDARTNTRKTQYQTISKDGLPGWLGHNVVCRMVWVSRDAAELRNDIATPVLFQLLDAFGLKSAYSYYSTAFAGAASLPPQRTASGNIRSYSFCYHPKIILLWSRNASQNCIQGICFAGKAQITAFQELLNVRWPFLEHDMMPAFLCSVLLSSEVNTTQNAVKQEVRETEVRTGFHRWSGRREQRASGDLSALSAKMSGCASKYASVARKMQVVEDLNEFILEQISDLRDSLSGVGPATQSGVRKLNEHGRALEKHVQLMQRRVKMQQVDVEFFEQRVTVQLNAVSRLFLFCNERNILKPHLIEQNTNFDVTHAALQSHRPERCYP